MRANGRVEMGGNYVANNWLSKSLDTVGSEFGCAQHLYFTYGIYKYFAFDIKSLKLQDKRGECVLLKI